MRTAIAIAVAALATLAAPANAAMREDAIASRSGIPTPPGVTIFDASCPEQSATEMSTGICAYPDGRIYLARADEFGREHEIGHVFIRYYLSAGEKSKATRLEGFPAGVPWYNGTGVHGFNSPDERTADAYAACRLGLDPAHEWETSYDYQPSPKQFRAVCGFLRRAAKS